MPYNQRMSVDNNENLPEATNAGELSILGKHIPCAVLSDGRRVLTQQGFLEAMGRASKAKGGQGSSTGSVPFLVAKNLQPFIPLDLRQSLSPIKFRHALGYTGYGYPAEALPRVCEVYLQARASGVLYGRQLEIANACEILLKAISTVGIVALVDEASGYQFKRAKDALAKILDAFVAKELRKWTKTFDDEYYRQLFRLRNISYEDINKRPAFFGHETNDYVYERLAPGLLEELKRLSPKNKGGRRSHLHRRLTEAVGHPRLREHLSGVIALMKSSRDLQDFIERLNLAYPKYTDPSLFNSDDFK